MIYPNPTKDFFEIKGKKKVKEIVMFDATGKKVKNFKSSLEKYDISNLNSGVYYLEIISNDGEYHYEKLLKN